MQRIVNDKVVIMEEYMDNKLKDNTFNFKVDNIMNDAFEELQTTLGFSNKTKVFEFMIVKTLESMVIRNNP